MLREKNIQRSTFLVFVLILEMILYYVNTECHASRYRGNGWVRVNPPSEKDAACANHSKYDWIININNGNLYITAYHGISDHRDVAPFKIKQEQEGKCGQPNDRLCFHGRRFVKETEHGYLIGYDRGEYGGGLFCYSADGSLLGVINNQNVNGIIRNDKNEIIVFQGLDHLDGSYGYIRKIKFDKSGKWSLIYERKIGYSIVTYFTSEDGVHLIFGDGLYFLNWDNELRRISNIDLTNLVPNSIVKENNGDIWIGMSRYVLHLYIDSGKNSRRMVGPE